MNNFLKKSFLVSMVLLTALFGVVGVVAPVAQANISQAGDLIRTAALPAVYYVDASNVRHSFSDQRVYNTWYKDFSTVKVVSTDEMLSYTTGSSVVARPGARLAQYVTVLGDGTWSTLNTPDVFAVGPNGQLHKIDSAATAVAMYGANWETQILPIPEYLGGNYTMGSIMNTSSMYPDGTLVKMSDSAQVYVIQNGQKRPVTDAGFTANMFNSNYVTNVTSLASYADGSSVTGWESALSTPMGGAQVVTPGTGLTVAMAVGNPGQQVAPIGATSIELMRFNLSAAADGAATISDITVMRNGVGAAADWSNLYLYEGATRLTSGKSVNSTTQKAQFNNLGLTVAAGSTRTLSLRGDSCTTTGSLCTASATAGDVHYFTLASADVVTTATLTGSFPLVSSATTIGSAAAGTITIAENGSLSGPAVGDANASVAQFTLAAGSAENVVINRLALYQAGSINNGYLSNFKLYQGATQLGSTVASISSKSLIIFDLATAPYTLDKNQTRTFTVKADISTSARDGDTSKIYLDQASDLYAVGAAYGYGVTVIATSYDGLDTSCTTEATCSDSTYVAIEGGQITVSKSGPDSTNYAVNDDNLVLLNFTIAAAIPVEIRSWRVELHNDSTDLDTDTSTEIDDILNVRITATDGTFTTDAKDAVNFSEVVASDAGIYTTYTDTLSMAAGTSKSFQILMDTDANLPTTGNYYAVLGSSVSGSSYTFSSTAIRSNENNQYVTDIVPSGATTGEDMSFAAASLTTALGNFTGAQTVVKGASNVEVLYYNLTAGNASDINISQIQFTSFIDDDVAGTGEFMLDDAGNDVYVQDVINNFKLYEKSGDTYTQIGNTEAVSSGYITFDNLNYTIAKGATKTIVLKGDVSSSAYLNSNNEQVAFEIITGSITASYGNGTDLGSVTANRNHATVTATEDTAWTMTDFSARTTIANTGTLTVDSNDNPASANVVAGTNDVNVLNLVFNAQTEAFRIEKFRIIQSQTDANGGDRSVNSVKVSYPNQAGTTVTVTQSVANGVADFDLTANPLYVPANSVANVQVYANLRAISANATDAKTGDQFKIEFDEGANFRAVGSAVLTHSNWSDGTDEAGNIMTVRKAIPTFSSVALSTGTLIPGQAQEFYKFRVTASQGSSVDLKKVHLKTTLSGGNSGKASIALDQVALKEDDLTLTAGDSGTDTYRVYAGTNTSATAANIISGDTDGLLSSTSGAQNVFLAFNDDRTVSAGSSKVYTLSGMIAYGAGTTNAASYGINTYLYDPMGTAYDATTNPDANVATRALGYIEPYCANASALGAYSKYCLADVDGANDKNASYIWSDHSGTNGNNVHTDDATGHTGSSNDWTNGYLLKTLGQGTTLGLNVANN